MKIDRLMGILTLLLQKEKLTAPELASRFEVSRRTINRDIEDLCKAGIPVITLQGRGGGIALAEGYKIQSSFFTRDELWAVLSGVKALDSVSKKPYTGGLLEKLSVSASDRRDTDIIQIDLSSFYTKSISEKLDAIKAAILNRQLITFTYYYEKGQSQRKIEPYRLVFRWGGWYVFGYCLERQDFRLFKLLRLWELETSPETFSPREIPPEKLELDRHFSEGAFHLTAVFQPCVRHRLVEEYGPSCCTQQEDGGLLFHRDFASYENMRAWILSFGDKVRVLSPDCLAEDRLRQAENILKTGIHDK